MSKLAAKLQVFNGHWPSNQLIAGHVISNPRVKVWLVIQQPCLVGPQVDPHGHSTRVEQRNVITFEDLRFKILLMKMIESSTSESDEWNDIRPGRHLPLRCARQWGTRRACKWAPIKWPLSSRWKRSLCFSLGSKLISTASVSSRLSAASAGAADEKDANMTRFIQRQRHNGLPVTNHVRLNVDNSPTLGRRPGMLKIETNGRGRCF